jgi:hypothetical protein
MDSASCRALTIIKASAMLPVAIDKTAAVRPGPWRANK